MRVVCAALNCKYSSESEDSSAVIFVNFPNDDTAKAWAESCGRSDLTAKSNAELHLNYYICSHHIEERYYISKTVPIVIKQGAVPTLFRSNSSTDNKNSINIFNKSQHLQEVEDNESYYDMNVEIDEYQDIAIKFSNLCRICGESILNGVDIFAAKGVELRLKEKICLHMPISIDTDDSMPRKVCIDCCNKLETVHRLVVSCLKTDMRLKKYINIEKEPEYGNKYNVLVEECSSEIAQEMCMDDGAHSSSAPFTVNKMVNTGLETNSRDLKDKKCSGTQSENIDKNVISGSTVTQTYRKVNSRNNKATVEEKSPTRQSKMHNENYNILCLQCQTFCETREIFESHKIFCAKEDNNSKRVTAFDTTESKRYNNDVINLELRVEDSQADDIELESELIDKSKIHEQEQAKQRPICSQLFGNQPDFDNHEYLHENLTEKTSVAPNKRCGHCQEVYCNKKDLLKHFTQSHEGRMSFGCFICDKTYEKWSSLDIHEATHRTDKPYLCDLCGKRFKHSNNLRGHKRIHLDESVKKRHMCEVCGSAFRSRFHLREHKNQHDDNRPYSCEQCGKAFYKRIQLRQHKLTHGSNQYTCPVCNATFNRRGNMNTHMKRHSNGDGAYTCSVCTHKFKSMSELKMHRKKHTEEEIMDSVRRRCVDREIWRCDICGKVFPRRVNLTSHERTHGDNRVWVECDECGKKLASKSSLMYHKRSMHLKEKPQHMCHYCGDSFVSRKARLVHERTHTGERPYVCDVCNMRYRCSSNLSQHAKIHTGLKPHKCHYCSKGFMRKGALIVHERVHTGVKPYPCEICGRCFSQKNDMLKHVKTHDGKSMQCDQCNEVFKRKKDMLKHIATHERDDTSAIPKCAESPPRTGQSNAEPPSDLNYQRTNDDAETPESPTSTDAK